MKANRVYALVFLSLCGLGCSNTLHRDNPPHPTVPEGLRSALARTVDAIDLHDSVKLAAMWADDLRKFSYTPRIKTFLFADTLCHWQFQLIDTVLRVKFSTGEGYGPSETWHILAKVTKLSNPAQTFDSVSFFFTSHEHVWKVAQIIPDDPTSWQADINPEVKKIW